MAEEKDGRKLTTRIMSKLNAEAAPLGLLIAILGIVIAVGGGIIHLTNQIAVLQTTSDSHTKQIDKLSANHEQSDAKMDWIMRQLDLIRLQTNSPVPQGKPSTAWPTLPDPKEGLTGKAAPPRNGISSLFPQVEISRKTTLQETTNQPLYKR